MATNITLGAPGDTIDLTDATKHFVLAESFNINGNGTVSMTVMVRDSSSVDDAISNYRSIQSKLNDAETAYIEQREPDRVELGTQLGATNMVYYDVRRGKLEPTGRQSPTFNSQEFRLTLEVENIDGWPVARGAADVRATTGTLQNGHARILIDNVEGDLPAFARLVLTDVSTSGTISAFRGSRRSQNGAGTADWSAWIDLHPSSPATNTADGSSLGGSAVSMTTSSTNWSILGLAYGTIPSTDLNKGTFHVYARVKARDGLIAAPTSGTAIAFGNYVTALQDVSGSNASSGTSISATWGAATTSGSTLIAAVKGHKNTERFAIGTIDAGASAGTITTTQAHGLASGDRVLIEGVDDTEPDINGLWTATVVDSDSFTIPIGINVGGSSGSIRETFYESISSQPSGYIQIGYAETPNSLSEAAAFMSQGGGFQDGRQTWGGATPQEADEWDQTKLWLFAKPSGASESGAKSFGWTGAITNRAVALLEIDDVPSANGGLGAITLANGDSILSPPSAAKGSRLLGVSASKDQSFQPIFGFTEHEDTGGLMVASKYLEAAGEQPYAAIPNDYDFSILTALIEIFQDANPETYSLESGQYQFRVQAVDGSGGLSTPTSTFSVTLAQDSSAIQVSWSAPTATSIDHYLITVSYSGIFYEIETPDSSTSYVLTSLANLPTTSGLPTAGSFSAGHIRAFIGTDINAASFAHVTTWDDIALDPDLNNTFSTVKLGTFTLPPQGETAGGTRPAGLLGIQVRSGGGVSGTVQVDAIHLVAADEPAFTLVAPGYDASPQSKWVFETNRAGRPVAWRESPSGGTIYGDARAPSPFTFSPGDQVLEIESINNGGTSTISNRSQFTAQVTIYPRYLMQQGS